MHCLEALRNCQVYAIEHIGIPIDDDVALWVTILYRNDGRIRHIADKFIQEWAMGQHEWESDLYFETFTPILDYIIPRVVAYGVASPERMLDEFEECEVITDAILRL